MELFLCKLSDYRAYIRSRGPKAICRIKVGIKASAFVPAESHILCLLR